VAGQSESLNLRVTPELKQAVVEYAARFGITLNAAAAVLLTKALESEARQRDRGE
jgi:predicted HicB family RNase H-like nuclease